MIRPIEGLLATALVSLLVLAAGCAAEQSYRSAQELQASNRTEEALRAYQQALQQEPTNARYRIAYLGARDKAVAQWLADADRLRRNGEAPGQARALYQRVLGADEGNFRAQAGLAELERDERVADLLARARAEQQRNNVDTALAHLRTLLAMRPQHAEALALRNQLQEQRNKPRAAADAKLAEAYRKPVSLEFRDVPIKQLFEVLSRSSGLNFVLDKDVRADQRTTLFLRNTTVADALNLALLTNQLEQRVLDANTILVYPNTQAKLREYQPLSMKTFVLSVADAKTVGASLKTLLKTRDLVIDEKQNMIIMRDSPEAIQLAERLVALHDQPEAEVMLDVEILEIKRSKLLQAGVQYPTQVALAPMASASGAALTLADLRSITSATTSVSALSIGVQATDTVSDINVLANPRIRSRNREKAKIQVGQRVPNITSTSTSTGFVAESVQYVDVGLKLEVEPIVSPDGEVTIKMGLEVSSILRQIQTKAGSIAYEIGTRNANTVLRLRDGENQVLAGLINDEDRRSTTGIPGLSSIPALGRTLFGNSNDDYQKSEIVLSITPRIVRPAYRPELLMAEFESGTEASLRSRGGELGPAGVSPPQASTPPGRAPPAVAPAPAAGTPPDSGAAPATGAPDAPRAAGGEPAEAPPAAAPPVPPGAGSAPSSLYWRGTASSAIGGLVTVELWASASQPLSVVPLTLGYDPNVLTVVSVDQGSFMGNAGTASTLSKRAEPGTGVIRAVISAAGGAGKAAEGSLLRVVFRARAASDATRVSVSEAVSGVTATGEALVLAPPAEWAIRVK